VTLEPIERGVVRQLFDIACARDWEVFFVTQRPGTMGETVQRQTQRWLIDQGFQTPSVLTLGGSRGRACGALELDFLIDDLPKNCVDVVADSKCRRFWSCASLTSPRGLGKRVGNRRRPVRGRGDCAARRPRTPAPEDRIIAQVLQKLGIR